MIPVERGEGIRRPRVSRFFSMRPGPALLVFLASDVVLFGIGMGVPFFCIVLGFVVGWYIVKNSVATSADTREVLGRVLKYGIITSCVTFLLAAVAWGRTAVLLLDPQYDFEAFGIPMILFQPRASFIGWLVLMILVSPCLQLLTTVFGSYVTFLRLSKDNAL